MKYIDTSAIVKAYSKFPEKGDNKVKLIMKDMQSGNFTLVSSTLMIGEAISVFDKRVRRKEITTEEFLQITKIFLEDIKDLRETGRFILADLSSKDIWYSLRKIFIHHLPINDSIHLQTALNIGVTQFISSDRALNLAALQEGLQVVDPEI